MKSIYELQLHESTEASLIRDGQTEKWDIIRVPNGWIYSRTAHPKYGIPDNICFFVPYSDEFKVINPKETQIITERDNITSVLLLDHNNITSD